MVRASAIEMSIHTGAASSSSAPWPPEPHAGVERQRPAIDVAGSRLVDQA
jgi:hypothetical protein